MVEYRKDPRESAFSRFTRQALGSQKKTETKAPSYGQIQQNVAKEREQRVDKTDNRIKELQQGAKETVSRAVEDSAWTAPKQQKITPTTTAPKTTTQPTSAGLVGSGTQKQASQTAVAPGATESKYRSRLAQEVEGRMQESQSRFEDAQERLRKAEEGLAQELQEAAEVDMTGVGQASQLESRSEAINRMLAEGTSGAGALGELNRYNVNYDPRFAALESMAQQGSVNLAREEAIAAQARDEAARAEQTRAAEDYLTGLQRMQEESAEQFRAREDEMRQQAEDERAALDRERQQYLDQGYTNAEIDAMRDFEDTRAGGVERQEALGRQFDALTETFNELGGHANLMFKRALEGGPEEAARLSREFDKQMRMYQEGTHPELQMSGLSGNRRKRYAEQKAYELELLRDKLGSLENYMYNKRRADEAAGLTFEDYERKQQERENKLKALSRITGGI